MEGYWEDFKKMEFSIFFDYIVFCWYEISDDDGGLDCDDIK